MAIGQGNGGIRRSFTRDDRVLDQKLTPGIIKRIGSFAKGYTGPLVLFLFIVILTAATDVINPLIYRAIIDSGVLKNNVALIVHLALIVGGIAIFDALLTFFQRRLASRIGQSMLLEMRTRVFAHIQTMSIAFFTRTRTGALVSRLNTDVSGISSAFTDILSNMLGNVITTVLVLIAMFVLSWQLTLVALLLIPLFIIPGRLTGKKLQALTRESYDISSDMYNTMIERFNVAGAQLAKNIWLAKKRGRAFYQKGIART